MHLFLLCGCASLPVVVCCPTVTGEVLQTDLESLQQLLWQGMWLLSGSVLQAGTPAYSPRMVWFRGRDYLLNVILCSILEMYS